MAPLMDEGPARPEGVAIRGASIVSNVSSVSGSNHAQKARPPLAAHLA